MRIRPTELGLKGLLLLLALEVAFLATSYSNLFFLLIVFCCVLGGLGLLTGVRNLRRVRVLAVEAPAAAADRPRPLRLVVAVRGTAFDLEFALEDARGDTIRLAPIATLEGNGVLQPQLPGHARGVCAVRALRIASRFPFGLVELRVRHEVALELVTYPTPAAATRSARDGRGGPRHADQGQPASVAGLRPFRSGDAVRDVHWKATARRGEPVVKERDGEAGDTHAVVVDRRVDAAALELELARATAVVLDVATAAHGVWLLSQDCARHLPPGQAPPADVLRWLAAAEVLPADAKAPERPAGHRPERTHA